jgi:hypothetical protein
MVHAVIRSTVAERQATHRRDDHVLYGDNYSPENNQYNSLCEVFCVYRDLAFEEADQAREQEEAEFTINQDEIDKLRSNISSQASPSSLEVSNMYKTRPGRLSKAVPATTAVRRPGGIGTQS